MIEVEVEIGVVTEIRIGIGIEIQIERYTGAHNRLQGLTGYCKFTELKRASRAYRAHNGFIRACKALQGIASFIRHSETLQGLIRVSKALSSSIVSLVSVFQAPLPHIIKISCPVMASYKPYKPHRSMQGHSWLPALQGIESDSKYSITHNY